MNATALLHLLQFASPALAVGGHSHSQGLEAAFGEKLVIDAASAGSWITRQLHEVVAQWDAPLFWRLLGACAVRDHAAFAFWSESYLASRDTAEFRAGTVQMGYSLARLLAELGVAEAPAILPGGEIPLPAAFACAVDALGVPHEEALLAMLFSWAENQVLVCVKSVPLGQAAGQRLLLALRPELERAALYARGVPDDALANWSPGLSMLSMPHEVQHGRLTRS